MVLQQLRSRITQMGRTLSGMRRMEHHGRGKVRPASKSRILISPGSNHHISAPVAVSAIETADEPRIKMPSEELNRVLGGGLVPGSIILIGGEPGIGKSTLVLQNILSIKSRTILYVSGEESARQIKMRADRIGRPSDNVFIVCETSLQNIEEHIEKIQPGLLIVDSIQTIASDELESVAGSVSQVRECASRLLKYAKESSVPVMLIGHITKDGNLAGPKVLEHIVDAVLHFEGDGQHIYRLLRAIKTASAPPPSSASTRCVSADCARSETHPKCSSPPTPTKTSRA